MKGNIEELITLNYELEGLFHLVLHRGDDTPEKVWRMIADKLDALSVGVAEHLSDADMPAETAAPVTKEESAPAVETVAAEENHTEEKETENAEESAVETEVDTPHPNSTLEPLPLSDEVVHHGADMTPEERETAVKEAEAEAAETMLEDEPEVDPTATFVPYTEETSATVEKQSSAPEPGLRLDEKLARANSRDLRRAFSLNDRFRFRRELFANSDTEMTDTLNLVEAMTTLPEAEDYFYNDLGWDRKTPEVAEFMAIIKQHFSGK